jgi:hypothetical protein
MPGTTRAFVKASIVYFCLGAILGALMLIDRSIPLGPAAAYMRVSHIQLLIVGWLTQLILGVAWWLFPPLKIGLRPDSPLPIRRGQTQRGSESLFWATFVCLNAGILLRAVFDPLYSWSKLGVFGFLAGISGLFLFVAAIAFVLNMWGRIRGPGQRK